MTETHAKEIWQQIVKILEEKLQFGFLEQEKSVVNVEFDGAELTLTVASDEAFDFFNAEINQQRLIIVSRPVISLDKVLVKKVDAEPLQ